MSGRPAAKKLATRRDLRIVSSTMSAARTLGATLAVDMMASSSANASICWRRGAESISSSASVSGFNAKCRRRLTTAVTGFYDAEIVL